MSENSIRIDYLKKKREELLNRMAEKRKSDDIKTGRGMIGVGLIEMELKEVEGELEYYGVKLEQSPKRWIAPEEAKKMADEAVKEAIKKVGL